jgi:hypothetical protein
MPGGRPLTSLVLDEEGKTQLLSLCASRAWAPGLLPRARQFILCRGRVPIPAHMVGRFRFILSGYPTEGDRLFRSRFTECGVMFGSDWRVLYHRLRCGRRRSSSTGDDRWLAINRDVWACLVPALGCAAGRDGDKSATRNSNSLTFDWLPREPGDEVCVRQSDRRLGAEGRYRVRKRAP